MMRKFWLLVGAMGLAGGASADIYKCADAAGHVTYSNVPGKSCTRLVSGGDSGSSGTAAAKAAPRGAAANPTPSGFPRVDGSTQKTRDDDRRRILENELQAEQKSLEEARKELEQQQSQFLPTERIAGGGVKGGAVEERVKPYRDRVALHERNLEALRKEIGNLR